MFGYVTANMKELTKDQLLRYNAVYCGICRRIRENTSQTARLGLSYDMAFLALLLLTRLATTCTTRRRAITAVATKMVIRLAIYSCWLPNCSTPEVR